MRAQEVHLINLRSLCIDGDVGGGRSKTTTPATTGCQTTKRQHCKDSFVLARVFLESGRNQPLFPVVPPTTDR